MQAVDAQLGGQVIKVRVIGAHDRGVQVDPTIADVVPVAVFVVNVEQLEVAGVEAEITPLSSPAMATSGLMVEPGAYNPRKARLNKGLSRESRSLA